MIDPKKKVREVLFSIHPLSYRIKFVEPPKSFMQKKLFIQIIKQLQKIEDRRDFMADEIGIDMTAYDDTCIIPDRFNTVVIDGAVMYLLRFRANEQGAALHQQKFEKGMDDMRRLLLDTPLYLTSSIRPGRHFNAQSGIK